MVLPAQPAWQSHWSSIYRNRKDHYHEPRNGLRNIANEFGVAQNGQDDRAENKSHGITEAELTQLDRDECAEDADLPGERPVRCSPASTAPPENLELRKPSDREINASSAGPTSAALRCHRQRRRQHQAAYAKLQDLAASLRAAAPQLSEAQAFSKAFTENPELAAKAHRRPSATTSYAFPR